MFEELVDSLIGDGDVEVVADFQKDEFELEALFGLLSVKFSDALLGVVFSLEVVVDRHTEFVHLVEESSELTVNVVFDKHLRDLEFTGFEEGVKEKIDFFLLIVGVWL